MVAPVTTIKIPLMVYSAQLECKSVLQALEIVCNMNPTHWNYCHFEWQEKENMYLVNVVVINHRD